MKAQRAIAFARHMPVSKLARRVALDVRRRVRDRLPLAATHTTAAPVLALKSRPAALFAPRTHLAPRMAAGAATFCFLSRSIAMPTDPDGRPRIDWQAPGTGAANQLWRMNLHYMEFLEGIDDDSWARVVSDWLDRNAMPGPGAWRDSWNSYAVSLRVVVWLQELARREGRIPSELIARLEAAIVAQTRFLVVNLETDLGGNHLIKNIKALIWASACFEGDEPRRWRALALWHLSRELDHQIFADGMHDERSASYHCQVLADLLECRHALGADPLDGALDSAVGRMAQAAADLTHPDGGVALFNDSGLAMAYAPSECLDVYEQLLGQPRPQPRPLFAFPDAGYYGLRAGRVYLVADCGRIAPDDLPAHGHGDVLSFELSVDGHRMIVDQGVYEYVAGEKRQMARSAMSHNTVCFDGADQADFFGAFRCGRRPNVMVRRWQRADDRFVLEGSHDGFRHLPGAPIHVRRFAASREQIVITDRIEGRTDRSARVCFLLHPDVGVEIEGQRAVLTRGAARVEMVAVADIASELAVWWPDMGCEVATQRLVVPLDVAAGACKTVFELSDVARATL